MDPVETLRSLNSPILPCRRQLQEIGIPNDDLSEEEVKSVYIHAVAEGLIPIYRLNDLPRELRLELVGLHCQKNGLRFVSVRRWAREIIRILPASSSSSPILEHSDHPSETPGNCPPASPAARQDTGNTV
ncbi:MAG: hypothetical protein SFU56_16455 [Capsulimonadales bacterium]|nr:hypothetical protein [Capsulimonadales bacterium]